jgi:hypothetical protein
MKPYSNPVLDKKFNDIEAKRTTKSELLPGISPIWHSELRVMDIEEPSWIVDQLISKGGINAISGQPESHKSFVTLELIKAISLGVPFLGKFPTERCKALILDEENSLGRSKMRFNLLSDEDLDVAIVSGQHIKVDQPGVDRAIIKYCKANDIGVVVFDSLSCFHGANESSNPEMAAVFEFLQRIAQAGITVIFIHHEPKSSRDNPSSANLRGAGDILAKCDVHISMRHPKDDVNTILVKQLKNRDAERLPEFEIAVHRGDNKTSFEYVGEAPKQVGMAQRTDDAIIELLTVDGELYQGQIFEALKAIDGIGGQRKITDCLDALTPERLTCEVRKYGRKYYAIKTEPSDE